MSKISEPSDSKLFMKYLLNGIGGIILGPIVIIIAFLYMPLTLFLLLALIMIIAIIIGIYSLIIYIKKPDKKRQKLLEKWKEKHG